MEKFFSLVKISHTIFALPFALLGFFLGVHHENGNWDLVKFLLVIGCMFTARNAAMAFNRLADAQIDSKNPRTQVREIPSGDLSKSSVRLFIILNVIAFILLTYFINPICFYLSPVALLVILGYSYAKRYTSFSHQILGLGLALAPVGASLAVLGYFEWIPILLGVVVLLWVSGFDIIYAMQDEDIDRALDLHSIPSRVGGKRALRWSMFSHILCALLLLVTAYLMSTKYQHLDWIFWIGVVAFLGMLFYQHTLVKANDLSKVNLAFFTFNGMASVIFGFLAIIDLYI